MKTYIETLQPIHSVASPRVFRQCQNGSWEWCSLVDYIEDGDRARFYGFNAVLPDLKPFFD